MSAGAREVLKKRGLKEVLFLEWDFGNRDFGPIANRVKDAKPDFVWVGAIGLDGNLLLDAMKKIDYEPPQHFYMYPAPGPLVTLPEAKNALSVTIFEDQPPFPPTRAAPSSSRLYKRARATKAGLRRHLGRDAGRGLVHRLADPRGRRRRDQEPGRQGQDRPPGCKANQVDTIQGKLRFNGVGNFGDDLMRIKQVQNGKWVVVWPKEVTAGGAKLLAN